MENRCVKVEKSIIIDKGISYTRAAICEDDKLVTILLENNDDKQIQGTIYQGKVSNVVKGIKAAFIEIGQEKKAFLHDRDIPEHLKGNLQNNQRIMVQVVKEGAGNKGPKVTGFINMAGQYIILLPYEATVGISKKIVEPKERNRLRRIIKDHNPRKYGVIVRTGAAKASTQSLVEELEGLIRAWEEIEIRSIGAAGESVLYKEPSLPVKVIREHINQNIKEIVINDPYEAELITQYLAGHTQALKDKVRLVDRLTNLYGAYGLDKEIEKALKKHIWLKSGANIILEKTEAMNVIDVNSAKLTTMKNKDKTILKANLEAAKESARQIRIRNLSGMILIDFIDMDNEDHENQVLEALALELSKDKVKTRLYPFTELGLVQITRQRKQLSLEEQVMKNCSCCKSSYTEVSYDYILVGIEKELRDIARESIHRSVNIKAGKELFKHLKRKPNLSQKIEAKYGLVTHLIEDLTMNHGGYEIKAQYKEI